MTDDRDEVALLPCPFCNSEAHFTPRRRSFSAVAGCINENCRVQPEVLSMQDADAIAAWNTRAQPEAVQALVEALEPFALLDGGDVNMNDPLRKWFTVPHLKAAALALAKVRT